MIFKFKGEGIYNVDTTKLTKEELELLNVYLLDNFMIFVRRNVFGSLKNGSYCIPYTDKPTIIFNAEYSVSKNYEIEIVNVINEYRENKW